MPGVDRDMKKTSKVFGQAAVFPRIPSGGRKDSDPDGPSDKPGEGSGPVLAGEARKGNETRRVVRFPKDHSGSMPESL